MEKAHMLQRCQSGDIEAIDQVFQSYHPAMFRLAYSILLNRDEADEAAQDAFIAAFDGIETCRGEISFRNWLYTITLNICRGRLRKRKVLERLWKTLESLSVLTNEPSNPTHGEQVETAILKKERSEALWQAVYQLEEKNRIPIVLHYDHDLTVAEIARILQTNEQTIYSRLHQARKHLYEALQGEYPLLFGGMQDE